MDSLTFEQLRLVIVVYTSSIVPLILIPYCRFKKMIPSWVPVIYVLMFIICALGWEIWFTYGWVDGVSVNMRRAPVLSMIIPMHLNWILNSLADAGAICLGGLLITWKILDKDNSILNKWNWKAFFILLFIFITQNIFVETFLYYDQLAGGKPLSWAPLSPLGSGVNPVIMNLKDRTVSLQSQVPWILMTPLFYGLLIYYLKQRGNAR